MADIKNAIAKEYVKCAQDYIYAIKTYCKIEHPLKGKILFNLYPFQEDTLTDFINHKYNVINKSRQMGLSTLVAAYALMNMVFRENYKVLVIATNQDVAKNMVLKVKVMFNNLPTWLRPKAVDNNKLQLTFDNGSTIKAVASSPTAGRSEALSLLIIDEAAFIENIDDIWASAQMTLATGGDAILLSTPNGVDNLFHKLCTDAESKVAPEGLEPFNFIKLKWNLHPERDQKWRDQQTFQLGPRLASQECDCDFLTSGHSVIDGEIIQWYLDEMVEEPVERRGVSKDYWLWKYPAYDKKYAVSVDVSRGDGEDESVIEVFDIETCEQVAEWVGHIPPRELGKMSVAIATEWNNALLIIDNRNIGWDTVQEAIDQGYRNLFYSYKNDVYVDPAKHIAKGYDLKSDADKVPGFTINHINRPMMISKLDHYFTNKIIKAKSSRLVNQLFVFVWQNGKPQARSGRRDDAIMATSQFLFIRDTALKLHEIGLGMTERALKHTHKRVYSSGLSTKNNEWSMQDGRGGEVSLKWLL